MKRKKALFTSNSDNWTTPDYLFNYLNNIYNFDFDPCPLNNNPDFNGLSIEWGNSNFVNPPYSNTTSWVDKAIEENKKGKTVVLLIPSRTDTKYFLKLYEHGCLFTFIVGRLAFSGKDSAPFPSVVIELKGNGENTIDHLIRKEVKSYENNKKRN